MELEWDADKEARNVAKHGISFVAAARVLGSGTTYEFQSIRGTEPRRVAIGEHPETRKVIAVVYLMRQGRHRIISARRARHDEEEEYRKRIGREAPEREERAQARPNDRRESESVGGQE